MAMIDLYRNNITRKNKELIILNEKRGKESRKLVQQNNKIILAKQAISKTKSQATINSKLREIERAEKEASNIHKKIADYDRKIASKQKEINNESSKLQKEEARILKKKNYEEQKKIKENERRMQELMERPFEQYNNYGGQMNIAKDNAIINATYNNYTTTNELDELDELIATIKDADLSVFNDEEQEVLIDNIDVLEEQLNSDNPKKGFIKTAIAGLTNLIYKSAELTEPIQKLIEFAKSFIE